MNFDTAFDRLMGSEGGYVNHPDDPGGETKWGISKRSYPQLNIAALTRDDAKLIYRRDFWGAARMDEVPPSIAFQVFDAAVNHGIENATRMLQKAVGVADDGHIGPITLAAVKRATETDTLMRFVAARLRFWTKLSKWSTFGAGWANRAADDLDYAAIDA